MMGRQMDTFSLYHKQLNHELIISSLAFLPFLLGALQEKILNFDKFKTFLLSVSSENSQDFFINFISSFFNCDF